MSRTTRVPDDFDLILAAWFESDAHGREPEMLLGSVIDRTSRTRPLPAWRLPERWIPMDLAMQMPNARQRLAPLLLLLLLGLALVAGALLVGARNETKLPPPFGLAANGQIVYIAGDQLFRANADGSSAVSLTPADSSVASPIFSRDGTHFAYRRLNGGAPEPTSVDMVVARSDGTDPVVIDMGATAMTNPSWSPDGRWLAYVRYDGDPFGGAEASHLTIAAADGSEKSDLGNLGFGVWGPSFSPDGTMVAVAGFDGGLHVLNRDGKGLRKLTHKSYPGVGMKGLAASWSPDGKMLVFSAGEGDVVDQKLYIVGLDGAPEREFSPAGDNQDDAVFSPDGRYVAFLQQAFSDRGPIVVIADASGKVIKTLPGIYGWHMPEWSPDGTRLAILDPNPDAAGAPPGQSAIVILDVFGTTAPTHIYIPGYDDNGRHPDYSLTWQRLALP